MVRAIIGMLAPLQFLFLPALLIAGLMLLYRALVRDDRPAGLALYIGTVMLLDSYMEAGLFFPGFEKGSIKYSEIIWLLLFLKDRSRSKEINRGLGKKMTSLVTIYIILLFIAACRSENPIQGIFFFRAGILPQFLAFCLGVRGLDKRADYKRFFSYLTILVLFLTVFHIWLYFNNSVILKSAVFYSESFQRNLAERRYGSIFGNPNTLGVFIVLLCPIYVAFLAGKEFRKVFFFNVLALLFLLSQTRSRGPMLALAAALGLMFVLRPIQLRKVLGWVLLGSIVFSLAMPGFLSQLTRRFRSEGISREIEAQDNIGRSFLWKASLRMIQDYPLGIGLNDQSFLELILSPRYTKGLISDEDRAHVDNPHNSVLEIAIKAGVQALVPFLAILFLFFKNAARILTNNRDDILFALGFGIFAYTIAINSEPIMFRPNVANLFWIILGLAIFLIDQEKISIKQSESARTEIQET